MSRLTIRCLWSSTSNGILFPVTNIFLMQQTMLIRFVSRRTVIVLSVYKISSLKITLPNTLQLKALSTGFSVSLFHCFILIWKTNRLEVYYSVFLLFSRRVDHFISYSRIVYIGDSLGHVICLLIYFWLTAILLNIWKCIST